MTVLIAATLACCPSHLFAQEQDEEYSGTTSALLEEVVVTARKREEMAQQVPISISAFNADQLDALKVRKIDDLTVGMPNVSLDDVGTIKSVANFSIRGLGINSSIPSIDPTVGVFVDGVYMGLNQGVVIDFFDIQSIEVLRGPQGTLFGRNVTGGAVLINTKKPGDELEFSVRGAYEANPNGDGGSAYYGMGAIGGPVTDNIGLRFSAYYHNDDGWFTNLRDGSNHGASETKIFRPVMTFEPSDNVNITLRWEHMESDGDGPASQTHTNGLGRPGFFANFKRDSFDFSIDEPGFYDMENDLVSLQLDWDVAFGDGTITNIFGWKDFSATGLSDIDAQPVWLFHAPFWNNQEQFSNELRYVGTFGEANVTTGIYWFTNEINYHERRNLLGIATGNVAPALVQDGGGNYNVDSLAWFGSVDYNINESWTLTGGLRFSTEDKSVDIASLVRNVSSLAAGTNRRCNVVTGDPKFCPFDFIDSDSWNSVDGKIGATWHIDNDLRAYGHISRSHRSGGYNLRNTAIDTVNLGPGPFDQEAVTNYEIGFKSEISGRGRLNGALFYQTIDDMQREINLADPIAGVVQVIKNTADAEIWGFELDGVFALGADTVLLGSVGWIDASYSTIFFDLSGDGVIDEKDKALELPRAPELTWMIGLTNDLTLGDWGVLSSRISYAYRDDAFYTDNNLGFLLDQEILEAGLDLRTGDHWVFSLYGKNLLDSVNHGGDTQLPNVLGPVPVGGTFSPLMRGKVVGLEISYNY
ncbi:MAG: TonB-dependent receptor [Xanthomonadales bacterium]|nr:TonB-dependent receptor [Xanthomonadales bacterium]